MSDFLSRLAARAVGAAPLARPRLPALFEAAPPGPADSIEAAAGIERSEEASRASAAKADRPATLPQEPTASPTPEFRRSVAASRRQPPARGEPQPVAPSEPGMSAPDDRARVPMAARSQSLVRQIVPDRAAESPPDARREVGAAAATTTAPPAVAATLRPEERTYAAPARSNAPAAAVEPTVRVHIGRLEVRAILPEPPPAHRRPAPREPDGLSLADYLRGKRDAR